MMDKDTVKEEDSGILIRIHAITGSSKPLFPAGYDNWRRAIIIKVRSEAKGGEANSEIIDIVSGFFGLTHRDVYIKIGERSRDKTLVLSNISYEQVYSRLEEAL